MPRTRGIRSFKGEISKIVLSSKNYQKLGENKPKISASGLTCRRCQKQAHSTHQTGKDVPVIIITKTRDFARICEEIKENRRFGWTSDFGLSDKTWTCGHNREPQSARRLLWGPLPPHAPTVQGRYRDTASSLPHKIKNANRLKPICIFWSEWLDVERICLWAITIIWFLQRQMPVILHEKCLFAQNSGPAS